MLILTKRVFELRLTAVNFDSLMSEDLKLLMFEDVAV